MELVSAEVVLLVGTLSTLAVFTTLFIWCVKRIGWWLGRDTRGIDEPMKPEQMKSCVRSGQSTVNASTTKLPRRLVTGVGNTS